MHEQSLMAALVRQAIGWANAQGATGIRRVTVCVGVLGLAHAPYLGDAFIRAAQNTLAEGAVLEVIETGDLVDVVLTSLELELTADE